MHRTWVEVSKKAVEVNLALFQKRVGENVTIMPVIKANAYGHGAEQIGEILELNQNVTRMAVDSIEEAIRLRNWGVQKPIVVMGWVPEDQLQDLDRFKLEFFLTFYDARLDKKIKSLQLRETLKAHLKIDTGLARQGESWTRAREIGTLIAQNPNLDCVGLASHFASAEEGDHPVTAVEQWQRFESAKSELAEVGIHPSWIHMACSAVPFSIPEANGNVIRLGIGLYGIWPSEEIRQLAKADEILQPVLSWKARIAQVKEMPSGSRIGYDGTERVDRDSRIAIVPVGYAEGYFRSLSSKGIMLVRGIRCRVIGRVCMNMCMLDVTDVSGSIKTGEIVTLIGSDGSSIVTADELAKSVGTISYEIVTRISPLIPRIIVA